MAQAQQKTNGQNKSLSDVDLRELHINVNNILKDNYLDEVKDLSKWKFHWRKIGNSADFASKISIYSNL